MRVDYRYLRLVSVPLFIVAIVLLVLVCSCPQLNVVVGGSARWLKHRAAAGGPPGRDREARARRLPGPLVRQARQPGRGFWGGTVAVPGHRRPGHRPRLQGARPRHDVGHHADRVHDVLRRRARTSIHLGGLASAAIAGGRRCCFIAGPTSSTASGPGIDPWRDPLGNGFHTIQGLLALGVGGLFGTGLGESRLAAAVLPNAFNDFIFAEVGQEFGLIGGGRRDRRCSCCSAYSGIRIALGGARHVRGAAGRRHHRLALPPGVHQHRRRRGAAADHRDHAAVHQRRRLVAHHQLRGGRDPAVDLARDRREGDVERRCDC